MVLAPYSGPRARTLERFALCAQLTGQAEERPPHSALRKGLECRVRISYRCLAAGQQTNHWDP